MERQSIVTCPRCGGTSTEEMPDGACVYLYECPHCATLLRAEPGDCCVFCSYGSVPCPPIQEERARRRKSPPGEDPVNVT
jgi:hypothetical protein